MTEEQLADVKFRIRPHFLDYLNKAGMYMDCTIPEEMRTACPVCGRDAIIQKPLFAGQEHIWSCGFCGHKGNVIDYVKAYLDLDEQRAVSYLCRLLNIPLESLHTITAAELMAKEFGPKKVLVEDLLTPGLYILAGAPKIGKSWLVLQLACFISKGLPLWDTARCCILPWRTLRPACRTVCGGFAMAPPAASFSPRKRRCWARALKRALSIT